MPYLLHLLLLSLPLLPHALHLLCGHHGQVLLHKGVGIQGDDGLVKFLCKEGYKLRGATKLACKEGKVEGELPVCVKTGKESRRGKQGDKLIRIGTKKVRMGNRKLRKRHEKHKRRGSKKYLKSVRDLMMGDQPPGLGIPYGNDIVGHQDQLVLLDDYDSVEDGRYEVGYDETEYDETEDYDYKEDYGETKEYDEENDYYDYDYEEGENEENDEDYEDYEEYEYDREDYSEYEEAVQSVGDNHHVDLELNKTDGGNAVKTASNPYDEMEGSGSLDQKDLSDDEDLIESSGEHVTVENEKIFIKNSNTEATLISEVTTEVQEIVTNPSHLTTTHEEITNDDVENDYYFEEEGSASAAHDRQTTDAPSTHTNTYEIFHAVPDAKINHVENADESTDTLGDEDIIDDFGMGVHSDKENKSILIVEKNGSKTDMQNSVDIVDDEDMMETSGYSEFYVEGHIPNNKHNDILKIDLETFDDEDILEGSGINELFNEKIKDSNEMQEKASKEEISDEESEYRKKFFMLHGIDLFSLDSSCMEDFVPAPSVRNAEISGYDGRSVRGKTVFAEVMYSCVEDYQLVDKQVSSLFCKESSWRGKLPECVRKSEEDERGEMCEELGRCEQLCRMEDGEHVCSCYEGFILSSDGERCEDVDECLKNNGGCSQICKNRPGTFMCSCKQGYSASGGREAGDCLDVNECLLNNGHGPCQDTCTNHDGGYVCSCDNLAGTRIGQDNHTCEAVGGCAKDNGGCSHQCINSYNQVFCMCPDGFVLGSDWRTCEDVDECLNNNNGCPHLCVNTPGSSHCACMPGYELSQGGECVDRDECDQGMECSHSCVNTVGSAYCDCPAGWQIGSDERTCEDINECQEENGFCQQVCINKPGSVECGCEVGYHLDNNNSSCSDINECSRGDLCNHGDCVNTAGSYTCQCHAGFTLHGDSCEDVDECAEEDLCGAGDCVNNLGTYECLCQPGYGFSGATCFDLDECLIGNPCVHGACENLEGGYSCQCYQGYYEEEGVCLDINECALYSPCGVGQCVNTPASYTCTCPKGYEETGGGCHDIDECAAQPCGPHGDCFNLPGEHSCHCHPGYSLVGDLCQDIDECAASPCIGGECVNLPGRYECMCEEGYLLDSDNNTCIDVDECREDNGGCHHLCINTPGSVQCKCHPGYLPGEEGGCEDHDECGEDNGGCTQLCHNLPGGHECTCFPGFQLGERGECEDINECLVDNGGCSSTHLCVNTAGSRLCQCRPGFQLSPVTQLCVDMDECGEGNGMCDQLCENTDGGHSCYCRAGYHLLQADNKTCLDINECLTDNGGCSHSCHNTDGGHECSCPGGQVLPSGGHKCQVFCSALARPSHGYYKCTTKRKKEGYVPGSKCRLRCRKGYKRAGGVRKKCYPDSSWSGGQGVCQPVTCPPLVAPLHGLVSCTGRAKTMTKCKVECEEGFIQTGSKHASCGPAGSWEYPDGHTKCTANFPPPFILCPPNQTKPLPPGSSSAYVMFSQPKTNVDWFRYVSAEPAWAKQLEGEMILGKHILTFLASSPVTNQTASCQLQIHIKDVEPPRVVSCPHSKVESLSRGQMLKKITWTEPVFKDNVAIQHVMASFLPGHYFPEGRHHVLYQAADGDGNRARCGFTITVKREKTQRSRAHSVLHLPPPRLTPNRRKSVASTIPAQCNVVPSVPNGKMECINKRRSRKCTPVCKEGHVFYQKFSSRPPTYICSLQRVDWKITKFIPDCSPVKKTPSVGRCSQGWEARDAYCLACPPGMFRNSAPLCQLCPKGTYSDRFGSGTCSPCPAGSSTTSLGTRRERECREGKKRQKGGKRGREGRRGLMHYNSWLNEEPYKGK